MMRSAKKSKQAHSVDVSQDIYSKDLGTMGIPREVTQNNQQYNFLYSNNDIGPGDYQPSAQSILPRAPVVSFAKIPGNHKSYTAQWEEKMEKYIGVKPSEKKVTVKKESAS